MKISIIVAIDKNRGIGKQGKLLCDIPEDLARFKRITIGHPVILGRKTFDSIGRCLPQRTNIIITRDKNYKVVGAIVVDSLEKALEEARKIDKDEVFIIGGGQIYNQAINLADKLYLTLINSVFEADTFFPDYSEFKKIVFEEAKELDGLKYKFVELER